MVAILPALAGGALTALGGFGASSLLDSLFGRGGSGSSGGGGGFSNPYDFLPEQRPYINTYLDDMFGVPDVPLASTDLQERLLKRVDQGKLGKQELANLYRQAGLDDVGNKGYFDALTDTMKKSDAQEFASLLGTQIYQGNAPSKQEIKDVYKLGKLSGNLGSPEQFGRFAGSYFAQTPEGLEKRLATPNELTASMQFGELVGTPTGGKLFKPTESRIARRDKAAAAEQFRANEMAKLFA